MPVCLGKGSAKLLERTPFTEWSTGLLFPDSAVQVWLRVQNGLMVSPLLK